MTTKQHPFFPIPVFETVLPNGLTIITAETPSQFVLVNLVFAAGSLDDGVHHGVAHFLEHLLYEGAARDGVHPKLRHLYPKGIKVNAETGRFETTYWIDGYASDLHAIIEALFSIGLQFDCNDTQVAQEKPLIVQELDERDTPDERLMLWERRVLFPHALALHHRGGGTKESVGAMTLETLRNFFDRFYALDNTALVVAGGVSHAEVLACCDVLLQGRENRTPRQRREVIEPVFTRATHKTKELPSSLTLVFPAAKNDEQDLLLGLVYKLLAHYPLGVLSARVRLGERFVYGLDHGASAWPKPYDFLEIGAPSSRFRYVEDVVFECIAQFIRGDWDGDLWRTVMADGQRFFNERRESSREVFADWLRESWLEGANLDFDAESIFASVTREQLMAIAGQYLLRDRYGCLSVVRV